MARKGENIYKRKDGRWERDIFITMKTEKLNTVIFTARHIPRLNTSV